MNVIRIASLGALMLALAACTSMYPCGQDEAPETVTTLVEQNRFDAMEPGAPDESVPAYADPSLDALRSPTLSRFRSEAEFLDWLKAVRAAAKARGVYSW